MRSVPAERIDATPGSVAERVGRAQYRAEMRIVFKQKKNQLK